MTERTDDFLEMLRAAGITPEKPLYPVLVAVREAAGEATVAAKEGARALSVDGERRLVRQIAAGAVEVVRAEFKTLTKALWAQAWALLIAAGLLLILVGYGARWLQEGRREVVAGGDSSSIQRYCAAHTFERSGRSACALPDIWLSR